MKYFTIASAIRAVNLILLAISLSLLPLSTDVAQAYFPGSRGKILYEVAPNSYAQPTVISEDGSARQQLTNINSNISNATWSPDGNYIFYTKQGGPDGKSAIYTMNSDGSNEKRVSEYGVSGDLAVSPDGTALAVTDIQNDALAIIDIEDGTYYGLRSGYYSHPVWSPDGTQILYSRGSGNFEKLDLASNTATQLPSHVGFSYPVDWSPDGSTIAYISTLHPSGNEGSEFRLYFMDPQGNNRTDFDSSIISRPTQNIYDASFSPDSNQIAYSLYDSSTGKTSLRVANGHVITDPTTILDTNIAWQSKVSWQVINNSTTSATPQPTPPLTTITRFYSPLVKHHLFTADSNEVSYIQAHFSPSIWSYEGPAFGVKSTSNCAPNEAVYRFYSQTLTTHLYTIDENEKNDIIARFPSNIWQYEGIAYCASNYSSRDTKPVYRFYSIALKTHLYTIDENEANFIMNNFPEDIWKFEGIAYYAYPIQ